MLYDFVYMKKINILDLFDILKGLQIQKYWQLGYVEGLGHFKQSGAQARGFIMYVDKLQLLMNVS